MAAKRVLNEVLEEYFRFRRSLGVAANTLRNDETALRRLMAMIGNIQITAIEPRHIDHYFIERRGRGIASTTLNMEKSRLSTFFKWAGDRGYLQGHQRPMAAYVMKFKEMPKDHYFIPPGDFPRLLSLAEDNGEAGPDKAGCPRDRMIVALGLYLFLRRSEIATLRVGDVDLEKLRLNVRVWKSSLVDLMPIHPLLEKELRRYLTWYTEDAGLLQPSWTLCPPRHRAMPRGGQPFQRRTTGTLNVTAQMRKLHLVAKRVIGEAGYPLVDENGRSMWVASHKLRQSGARAWFDHMVETLGHDGAGTAVQAALHHKSFTTTEGYLRLDRDGARRNKLMMDHEMFPSAEGVVSLEEYRAAASISAGM